MLLSFARTGQSKDIRCSGRTAGGQSARQSNITHVIVSKNMMVIVGFASTREHNNNIWTHRILWYFSQLNHRQVCSQTGPWQRRSDFERRRGVVETETPCWRDIQVACDGPLGHEHDLISDANGSLDPVTNLRHDTSALVAQPQTAGVGPAVQRLDVLPRVSSLGHQIGQSQSLTSILTAEALTSTRTCPAFRRCKG